MSEPIIRPISFTKGDTYSFRFRRRYNDGSAILSIAENVIFTVKRHKNDRSPTLQKSLGNGITFDYKTGYYYIIINPSDTKNMDFNSEYWYDIEINDHGGDYVFTPVKGPFFLSWNIT